MKKFTVFTFYVILFVILSGISFATPRDNNSEGNDPISFGYTGSL
ncbi:hypothetical protein [Ammoniphilus sp. 3BR4]